MKEQKNILHKLQGSAAGVQQETLFYNIKNYLEIETCKWKLGSGHLVIRKQQVVTINRNQQVVTAYRNQQLKSFFSTLYPPPTPLHPTPTIPFPSFPFSHLPPLSSLYPPSHPHPSFSVKCNGHVVHCMESTCGLQVNIDTDIDNEQVVARNKNP